MSAMRTADQSRSAAEDQRHADLETLQNYLDWQYAINGGFGTASFHRTLVREERPMPTLYEAREAVARLRAES